MTGRMVEIEYEDTTPGQLGGTNDQGRGRVSTTLAELRDKILMAGGHEDTPLEFGTDGEPLYITIWTWGPFCPDLCMHADHN